MYIHVFKIVIENCNENVKSIAEIELIDTCDSWCFYLIFNFNAILCHMLFNIYTYIPLFNSLLFGT